MEASIKKLELRHLAPYLPYGLKCQYEGIINGKELSAQDKEYKENGEPFDWNVTPVNGLKIGTIKSIHFKKTGWRCYIGIKGGGKAFYGGYGFKPILRPLSDFELSQAYHEINKTYTLGYDNGLFNDAFSDGFEAKYLPYEAIEIMFQHHFDVFGLIDAGLAIDINTLNPLTPCQQQ